MSFRFLLLIVITELPRSLCNRTLEEILDGSTVVHSRPAVPDERET